MKYITINDNTHFDLKTTEVNGEPTETDTIISNEIYDKFVQLQSPDLRLRIKENYSADSFDTMFEKYVPEPVEIPKNEIEILRETVDTLVLSMLEV